MSAPSTSAPQFSAESDGSGRFVRQANAFTRRVTADGSGDLPAEAGRYHLYVCAACPWAHRTIIVRELLGLQDAVSLSYVDPVRDERGWAFPEGFEDPVNGFSFLAEAYRATDPGYSGRVTVPTLWDRETGTVASNDYPALTPMLEVEFAQWHAPDAPDLYPEDLREEIEAVAEPIFSDVNNGVYRAGFATSQAAYEEAYDALFARLDALEERLSGQRYLLGTRLTEADVRLYTTLVRFDAVYHGHFKCNSRKITEYPALWGYLRDLYSLPAFGDTTDLDAIKRHYYVTHDAINPTGIVPKGPDLDFSAPHGREGLGS